LIDVVRDLLAIAGNALYKTLQGASKTWACTLVDALEISDKFISKVQLTKELNGRFGREFFHGLILLEQSFGGWVVGFSVLHPVN
jgi:hypothetical protein